MRAVAAALVAMVAGALALSAAQIVAGVVTTAAAAPGPFPRAGRTLIFLVDGMSVPEAMAVPAFRQLGRSGGLALMTTRVTTGPADPISSSYLTIGAGTLVGDPDALQAHLMARALSEKGVQVCSSPPGTLQGYVAPGQCPSAATPVTAQVTVVRLPTPTGSEALRAATIRQDDHLVRTRIAALRGVRTLVIVAAPHPSAAMVRSGDEVTPLIMAAGPSAGLLRPNGEIHALTSASTRQDGLVANTDVAPTVLDFFGVPVPSDMVGNPVRTTTAPAPFGLYRKEVQYRHIRFGLQILEVAYIAVAGAIAIAALYWLRARGTISTRAAGALRMLMYATVVFPLALLSGGLLPRLTYAIAIAYVVVVCAGLAVLATRQRWPRPYPGPYPAFGFLGAVGLAFIAIDLVTGSHALRVPLLGGVMFDGARYYGMPNLAISPLLASALFVAAGLTAEWGTALLVAAGLLAGLPWFGADIGGSVTLFAAAGAWLAVRRANGKMRPSVLGLGAAFAAGGLIVVLVANRFLSVTPTHATRFVAIAGSRVGSFFGTMAHRLGVGGDQFVHVPAAVIPMAGLIVLLILIARRPEPLRAPLRDRVWRSVIGVLSGAALVAYLANDTGVTAASPAFLYAMAALVVPTLAAYEGALPPKRRGSPRRREAPKATTKEAAKAKAKAGAGGRDEQIVVGAASQAAAEAARAGRRRRRRGRRR